MLAVQDPPAPIESNLKIVFETIQLIFNLPNIRYVLLTTAIAGATISLGMAILLNFSQSHLKIYVPLIQLTLWPVFLIIYVYTFSVINFSELPPDYRLLMVFIALSFLFAVLLSTKTILVKEDTERLEKEFRQILKKEFANFFLMKFKSQKECVEKEQVGVESVGVKVFEEYVNSQLKSEISECVLDCWKLSHASKNEEMKNFINNNRRIVDKSIESYFIRAQAFLKFLKIFVKIDIPVKDTTTGILEYESFSNFFYKLATELSEIDNQGRASKCSEAIKNEINKNVNEGLLAIKTADLLMQSVYTELSSEENILKLFQFTDEKLKIFSGAVKSAESEFLVLGNYLEYIHNALIKNNPLDISEGMQTILDYLKIQGLELSMDWVRISFGLEDSYLIHADDDNIRKNYKFD